MEETVGNEEGLSIAKPPSNLPARSQSIFPNFRPRTPLSFSILHNAQFYLITFFLIFYFIALLREIQIKKSVSWYRLQFNHMLNYYIHLRISLELKSLLVDYLVS